MRHADRTGPCSASLCLNPAAASRPPCVRLSTQLELATHSNTTVLVHAVEFFLACHSHYRQQGFHRQTPRLLPLSELPLDGSDDLRWPSRLRISDERLSAPPCQLHGMDFSCMRSRRRRVRMHVYDARGACLQMLMEIFQRGSHE